ncbi:6975_t:CDS:2, partial [Gigaspora margarita]
ISPIPGSSTEATSSFITPPDIPLRTPSRIPSPAPTTASFPNPLTQFINFITPGQHTVYSVHTEETNPIPPVIVDINPPNEEPIRTLTPEAPL